MSAQCSVALPPPGPFSFVPNEWSQWKNRFQRFRRGSGLDSTPDSRQIDVLIYNMGERAEEVYASFTPQPTTFDDAISKFDSYFIPKRNIIYERAKFLKHRQQSATAEQFITDLHSLANTCEWGELKDDMILLVLIIGMNETSVSDRLQLDPDLKLEKAICTLRQHEELVRQKKDLQGETVSEISKKYSKKQENKTKTNNSNKPNKNQDICNRCGYERHKTLNECPAKKANCGFCGGVGHYNKMCFARKNSTKHARGVGCSDSSSDESFIGEIRSDGKDPWTQKLDVVCEGIKVKPINFKLDTAADVTMIPVHLIKEIIGQISLRSTKTSVFSARKKDRFNILGTVELKLRYQNREVSEKCFVSEDILVPLLSRKACENLKLVQRVYAISSEINWFDKFPKLFKGLGNMHGEYKIEVKENAIPYAISAPRAVPVPLKGKVKEALKEMEEKGVIVPVDHSTDWCAPMVVATKKGGGVRICVDLSRLNKSVKRQFHPIPRIELSLAELRGAEFFTKLDANHGFWQLSLAKESQDFTTFITPFGRYKFCKLPFGVTSAPEEFQKRMGRILEGLKNCIVHMDDILIWGKTKTEHNECVQRVLETLESAGVTLNKQKSEFCRDHVTYLGFILSKEGITPDPSKVKAIVDMPPPKNVKEVQRFMGMVTFLTKFIPNRSEIMEPISSLISNKNAFVWAPPQQAAFNKIKELLTSAPCLAIYDSTKPTYLSCDASTHGLGAVLMQGEGAVKKPVAYVSRTLTSAEANYANIEREALALTWASDRLKNFLIGKHYTIETDHKPLLQIFQTKNLDDLSPRLQRFRLRMMRYDYSVTYTPGRNLFVADALSRNPLPSEDDNELEDEVDAFVHEVCLAGIHTTDQNVVNVANAQRDDPTCQQLSKLIHHEWPNKADLSPDLQEYYSVRDELCSVDGILLRGSRLIIPSDLRHIMLEKLHSGHLGITKTRRRAQRTLWWPGISKDIETKIKSCPTCIQHTINHNEPLIPSKLPRYPWQIVSMDFFKCNEKWFLVITDHYSRFIDLHPVTRMRASDVIAICQSVFAKFGIPEMVCSDSGTQFHDSSEFKNFSRDWGFSISTSSPHFHQANGKAEAAVKVAKRLLNANPSNIQQALLAYRNTPLENGFSPAEMVFGRALRDNVPAISQLRPPSTLLQAEEKYKDRYKRAYDSRHDTRNLSDLKKNDMVWITDLKRHGKILETLGNRSYLVETSISTVRRNRFHLLPAPYLQELPDTRPSHDLPTSKPGQLTTEQRTPASPSLSQRNTLVIPEPTERDSASTDAHTGPTQERASMPRSLSPIELKTRSGRTVRKPARYREDP